MSSVPCPVEGCIKHVHRKGFCYAHYMKDWRYGTPTPQHVRKRQDVAGKRFGALVASRYIDGQWVCLCDCGATTTVRIGDLNRGSIASCGNPRIHRRIDGAGYSAMHDRLIVDKGPVRQYECIDCGQGAQHWSYDHADPDERLAHGLSANPIAYSLKPEHYSPRCVPCHKRFDLSRRDAYLVG